MLGDTTRIFRSAENEPGDYFAHPDGDHSKTDGNNQERRRILTLRAGGKEKGMSWHSREKQFCVKRQWEHKLPRMKPLAIRAPLVPPGGCFWTCGWALPPVTSNRGKCAHLI